MAGASRKSLECTTDGRKAYFIGHSHYQLQSLQLQ
jgi:hypothetical protein